MIVLLQIPLTLQDDVDEATEQWNTHRIRPTRNQISPFGKPCIMYMLPHLYNTEDFKQPFNEEALLLCQEETIQNATGPSDSDFKELFQGIMTEHNLHEPHDFHSAKALYIQLRERSHDELFDLY